MNTLLIEPNLEKKTAKITGKVAVGELVSVTIDDVSSKNSSSLRLRVFCAGRVIAQHPAPDTTGSFTVSGDDLTCSMRFDSVEARRMCVGRETPVLLVLEDIGDNATLYFTQEWSLKGWPGIDTEDEPTDFSVYAFPTLVTQWKSELASAKSAYTSHASSTSNPHSVTKSQVGLGNVDNTSDANKPVSTATASAIASEKSQRESADSALSGTVSTETANRIAADSVLSGNISDEVERAKGVEASIRSEIVTKVNEEKSRAQVAESTIASNLTAEASTARANEASISNAVDAEKSRAVLRENDIAAMVTSESDRAKGVEANLASIASGVMKLLVVSSLPSTGVEKTIYLVPSASSSEGNVKDEYLWVNSAWEKIGSTSVDLSQYAKKTDLSGVEWINKHDSVDVYVHKNETVVEGGRTTSALTIYANLPLGLRSLSGKIPDGLCKEVVTELLNSAPSSLMTGAMERYVEISAQYDSGTGSSSSVYSSSFSGNVKSFSVQKDGITVESDHASFGSSLTVSGDVHNNSGWMVAGAGIGYSSDGKKIGYYSYLYNCSSSGEETITITKKAETSSGPSVVSPSASAAAGAAASAKATGEALIGKLTCNNISGKTISVNVSSSGGSISFFTSKDNSIVELPLSGHDGETIATTAQIPTATSELTNDSGFVAMVDKGDGVYEMSTTVVNGESASY